MTELKTHYTEIQTQLSAYVRKARSAKEFADLVERYTNITEVTAELLHTLVEKIVVHEKEVVDGQIIMRVDIHYRFIGKVGSMDGETTDSISDKAMRREYERRYPQRKSNRQKQKHNHDFDMSR